MIKYHTRKAVEIRVTGIETFGIEEDISFNFDTKEEVANFIEQLQNAAKEAFG